tara:strand:- start:93 stop:722 length:630 start_codon:yes stop_codon:yes gene_type:complete
LSWGIIADVDLESEVFRFLGPLRLDCYAVWRMLSLRRYQGKFSYMEEFPTGEKEWEMPRLNEDLESKSEVSERALRKTRVRASKLTILFHSITQWKTIEDSFVCFWACNTTHASYDIMSSPHSEFNDGVFQILLIRGKKVGRADLVKMFLGMENGEQASMDCVEFVKCVAYRVEPGGSRGNLSLDGEKLAYGKVQGVIKRDGGMRLLGS